MLCIGLAQRQGPLVIVQQRSVWQVRKRLHQKLIKMLRRLRVTSLLQENEILAQVDVPRLVRLELPQEKKIAQD